MNWLAWLRKLLPREEECPHLWSPCVVHSHTYNEDKPARKCKLCEEWQPLTEQQFFSQFGESFFSAMKRNI